MRGYITDLEFMTLSQKIYVKDNYNQTDEPKEKDRKINQWKVVSIKDGAVSKGKLLRSLFATT